MDVAQKSGSNARFVALILSSAVYGAIGAPVLGTLLMVAARPNVNAGDLLPWALLFTAPIGFVLGIIGGLWLGVVGLKRRGRVILALHGCLCGVSVSLPVVLLGIASDASRGFHPTTSIATAIVVIGALLGGSYAILFYNNITQVRKPN